MKTTIGSKTLKAKKKKKQQLTVTASRFSLQAGVNEQHRRTVFFSCFSKRQIYS